MAISLGASSRDQRVLPSLTLSFATWCHCTALCIGSMATLIAETQIADSAERTRCEEYDEHRFGPKSPVQFGARPGSLLSPGFRRPLRVLLPPPRSLSRCHRAREMERSIPPPPMRLFRTTLPPPRKRIRQDVRETLPSITRTQQALARIGADPGRTDGVPSSETTKAIHFYQKLLGAPATGRLTKDQRELLWEFRSALGK